MDFDLDNLCRTKVNLYEVRDIVCDYAVLENGKLLLILNSRANALLIKEILEFDTAHKVFCFRSKEERKIK